MDNELRVADIKVGDVVTWDTNGDNLVKMLVVKIYAVHGYKECAVVNSQGDYISDIKADKLRAIGYIDGLDFLLD